MSSSPRAPVYSNKSFPIVSDRLVYCRYMVDTHTYKNTLEDMLDTVIQDLERIAHFDQTTGDWMAKPEAAAASGEADPNVEADVVEDWNERRATLSQLETRYNNIKRALHKIEEGTYGVCEVSGAPIEPERLDANPAARTCQEHMNQEDTLPR